MSYVPSYNSRINWENEPSTASPINETNLNKMDYALYQHDQALQGQDSRISTLEGASKVTSFKGRTGAVVPANDDYTIAQIKATGTAGQVPTLNSQGKLEMADIPESGHEIVNPSGTSMTQRSKLKFMGSVSVSDDSANDQTVINVTGGGGGGSGHTIQNPSGSSMTQRTNLQFKGTGVTVTDNSTDDKTVVEITGGGGHTIENDAGTALTQRDVMQVTDGLEAVDDSTNQKTKIKMNLPTISLADWNAMTEQEKTTYKASHYRFGVELPDTQGVINAEVMKLLWENPNTTQAFAPQTITLNSADYDILLFIFGFSTGNNYTPSTLTVPKGRDAYANFAYPSTAGSRNFARVLTYASDTSYNVGACTYSTGSTGTTTENNNLVPLAIYGIKTSFQFKVNAIATELSTSASHCFLSDNETTVEDKFDELTNNNAGTAISLSSYTQANPYTCPSDGYMLIVAGNTSGNTIFGRVWGTNGEQLGTMSARGASQGDQQSLFVRKGCKIAPIVNTGTGNNIYFIPLQ